MSLVATWLLDVFVSMPPSPPAAVPPSRSVVAIPARHADAPAGRNVGDDK